MGGGGRTRKSNQKGKIATQGKGLEVQVSGGVDTDKGEPVSRPTKK